MLSKAELKELKALQDVKGRTAEGAFLAEGIKLTGELLGAFDCRLPPRVYRLSLSSFASSLRVSALCGSKRWGRPSTGLG